MYNYTTKSPDQKDILIKIKPEIEQLKDIGRNEKIILSQILFFEGLNKTEHSAGNKYFANLIGKSERTVTRCVQKLERLGYIAVDIVDRCSRIIKLIPSKIQSILSRGIDKMSKLVDKMSEPITSTINSIKGKLRTFTKTKEKKEIYKNRFYKKEVEREYTTTIFQEDNQSREEFDRICDYKENNGYKINRKYNQSNKIDKTASISEIFNHFKLQIANKNLCQTNQL